MSSLRQSDFCMILHLDTIVSDILRNQSLDMRRLIVAAKRPRHSQFA